MVYAVARHEIFHGGFRVLKIADLFQEVGTRRGPVVHCRCEDWDKYCGSPPEVAGVWCTPRTVGGGEQLVFLVRGCSMPAPDRWGLDLTRFAEVPCVSLVRDTAAECLV